MRLTVLCFTLAGILALLGCGNSNRVKPVNLSGNWTATLQKTSGGTAFSFTTSLTEVGGTVLNVSNLTFNPASSCFQSQTTASGVVQFSGGGGYGYYTGGGGTTAMSLTIKGLSSGGGTDTLNMQGSVNPDNSVSGTWTSNGVSVNCSGSGSFIMTRS